jgi:ketosteroid isomerase-like protein
MVLSREEIKDALDQWNKAWDKHDLNAVMELFQLDRRHCKRKGYPPSGMGHLV